MTGVTLQDSPQKRNSLPMLMLVVGLMAMPVIIAAGLYFIGWQPERTGNQGHLVSPPLPLPVSGLKTTDGSPLATAELHDKWLLLLSGSRGGGSHGGGGFGGGSFGGFGGGRSGGGGASRGW